MIGATPKLDLKVFAAPAKTAAALPLERVIPIFHRWIQERALDELMVDVADYTHVPNGPGVVLVCHEALYSLDAAGGELGLLYSRRRETHLSLRPIHSLDDRLASVFRRALAACEKLEREPDLGGALRFVTDRFLVTVNDRRVGPGAAEELGGALERLGRWIVPEGGAHVAAGAGKAGRIEASLRFDRPPGVTSLLARLQPQLSRAVP